MPSTPATTDHRSLGRRVARAIRSHPDAIATRRGHRVETHAQASQRIQGLAARIARVRQAAVVPVGGVPAAREGRRLFVATAREAAIPGVLRERLPDRIVVRRMNAKLAHLLASARRARAR